MQRTSHMTSYIREGGSSPKAGAKEKGQNNSCAVKSNRVEPTGFLSWPESYQAPSLPPDPAPQGGKETGRNGYPSACSFQVRVCCAASPWCCWCRCCGWRLCCCSCCTSTQQGGTVAEKRGVRVSKRVNSTSAVRMSRVNGCSTSKSTPGREGDRQR